jgi:hypothetical protein
MPAKMNENNVIDIIALALKMHKDNRVDNVSVDGDNKTSEIILTTSDGKDWVIRSSAIVELEPEGNEYEHGSRKDCVEAGDHLKSCDVDGYCNLCGEQ